MPEERAVSRTIPVAVLLAILAIYLPALHYGFFWDDPVFYGHVDGIPWWRLLLPTSDYHFYRPFYLLYNRFFLQADGTFFGEMAHWSQIGLHLLNVSLIYSIGRRLRLQKGAALAIAALVGTYPFSFQAVAWAAPGQPLSAAFQSGSWLAYLVARSRFPVRHGSSRPARSWQPALGVSLLLFLLALGSQESSLPLAAVPLLMEVTLQASESGLRLPAAWMQALFARRTRLALGHPLLAMGFLLVWLASPRYEGVIGLELDVRVTSYLSQGFAYPLLGRPWGYPNEFSVSALPLLAFCLFAILVMTVVAARKGRLQLAGLGLLWAWLSITPAQAGLHYSYASLAPRLLYAAAPGVVLAWVSALWPARAGKLQTRTVAGLALLVAIVVQSGWLLLEFRHFYQAGVEHLAQAITVQASEVGPHLFVNFPDRYEARGAPYPLGDWGLPLAPVRVELADFSRLLHGSASASLSRAVPWIDTEARENGPYRVALRGVITPADQLYELAATGYQVYLTRYLESGEFQLQAAGSVRPRPAGPCQLARFAGVICLHDVLVAETEDLLKLQLVWSLDGRLEPNVTIFAHLGVPGQPPLAQDDGDAWRGLMPLTMWQEGDLVSDHRTMSRPPEGSEGPSLQIGIYDRLSGERLPVTAVGNTLISGNAVVLPLSP